MKYAQILSMNICISIYSTKQPLQGHNFSFRQSKNQTDVPVISRKLQEHAVIPRVGMMQCRRGFVCINKKALGTFEIGNLNKVFFVVHHMKI
jgi:hypothetical protein